MPQAARFWEYSPRGAAGGDAVASLDEFVAYLRAVSEQFRRERLGDDWRHWYLDHYLEAMAAWLDAGHPGARLADALTWRDVATLFDAARVYE